jgi:hypothetical protein
MNVPTALSTNLIEIQFLDCAVCLSAHAAVDSMSPCAYCSHQLPLYCLTHTAAHAAVDSMAPCAYCHSSVFWGNLMVPAGSIFYHMRNLYLSTCGVKAKYNETVEASTHSRSEGKSMPKASEMRWNSNIEGKPTVTKKDEATTLCREPPTCRK